MLSLSVEDDEEDVVEEEDVVVDCSTAEFASFSSSNISVSIFLTLSIFPAPAAAS